MKWPLHLLLSISAPWMFVSCSCAIYGGNTYRNNDSSQRIDTGTIGEYASQERFRKTSDTEYQRGGVYLIYNENHGDFRIQGSYCGFPLDAPRAEIENELSRAEKEAISWFGMRGVRLEVVPTCEIINRNTEGEQGAVLNRD